MKLRSIVPLIAAVVFLSAQRLWSEEVAPACSPNGSLCDDGNSCTVDDVCSNGTCTGTCYCAARPSGLVGWWAGDGDTSDISGGGNHGKVADGAGFAAGKVGQAFGLDGIDDSIHVGNTSSMDFGAGDFSILVWLYFDSLVQDQEILHKVQGTVPDDRAYFLEFDVPSSLRFMVRSGATNQNDLTPATPEPLQAQRWYHVAAVRSGNTSTLYLDGAVIGSQTSGTNVDTGTGGTARIGDVAPNGGGVHRFFAGRIDELSVFNRALSAAEIRGILDAGGQGVCKHCTDTDGDGYGISGDTCRNGVVSDCALGDPAVWDLPGQITGLTATKVAQPGTIRWAWNPPAGGVPSSFVYDGERSFPPVCVLSDSIVNELQESAIPPSMGLYVFRFRGQNVCGDGPEMIFTCP